MDAEHGRREESRSTFEAWCVIGALAYSWQFAKEAIAGITPIDEMLKIAEVDGGPALVGRLIVGRHAPVEQLSFGAIEAWL